MRTRRRYRRVSNKRGRRGTRSRRNRRNTRRRQRAGFFGPFKDRCKYENWRDDYDSYKKNCCNWYNRNISKDRRFRCSNRSLGLDNPAYQEPVVDNKTVATKVEAAGVSQLPISRNDNQSLIDQLNAIEIPGEEEVVTTNVVQEPLKNEQTTANFKDILNKSRGVSSSSTYGQFSERGQRLRQNAETGEVIKTKAQTQAADARQLTRQLREKNANGFWNRFK